MKCQCGAAMKESGKYAMCGRCGKVVTKSGTPFCEREPRGEQRPDDVSKDDVLLDDEMMPWVTARATVLQQERPGLTRRAALRQALSEYLQSPDQLPSGDEHESPNHRPGTRAPSHPVPRQVGKRPGYKVPGGAWQGWDAVEKAEQIVRASGATTIAEDFEQIRREQAHGLWNICLTKAREAYPHLEDAEALIKWSAGKEAKAAYVTIDSLLLKKTEN
jgi:hypothetical protein